MARSASSEVNVYSKLIKMIFSHMKEYGIFTSEKKSEKKTKNKKKKTSRCYFHYSFRITSVIFIVSLTDADPTSVFFLKLL